MEDTFITKVSYQNQEHEFETRILWSGYQHKIEVLIDNVVVLFEPDEERHYRVILSPEQIGIHKLITPGLLQAIAHHLESFLRD